MNSKKEQLLYVESLKSNRQSKRVLIVDDYPVVRTAYLRLLKENLQLNIAEAETGKKALELLSKESYDLVILDISMPEISGFECLKLIREQYPKLPVIICSMHSNSHMIQKALQLGASDFISKNSNVIKEMMPAIMAQFEESDRDRTKRMTDLLQTVRGEKLAPELSEEMLTATTFSFVHHLNGNFAILNHSVKCIVNEMSNVAGGKNESLDTYEFTVQECLAEMSYMLQRFRNAVGRHPGVLRVQEVNSILHDVKSHFSKRSAFNKKIRFKLTKQLTEVMGDKELLWHLFENLIGNGLDALEECEDGCIWVSTLVNTSQKTLCISVRDNGSGIAPEHLPRIFDANFSTKSGGLGIGLFLANRSVIIHGGTIKVKSKAGKGSKFTVQLPLKSAKK